MNFCPGIQLWDLWEMHSDVSSENLTGSAHFDANCKWHEALTQKSPLKKAVRLCSHQVCCWGKKCNVFHPSVCATAFYTTAALQNEMRTSAATEVETSSTFWLLQPIASLRSMFLNETPPAARPPLNPVIFRVTVIFIQVCFSWEAIMSPFDCPFSLFLLLPLSF